MCLLIAGCDAANRSERAAPPTGPPTTLAFSLGQPSDATRGGDRNLSLSGTSAFNSDGTGTVSLSVPTFADERVSAAGAAPNLPGAPGLESVTIGNGTVSFTAGGHTQSAALDPAMQQLIAGRASHMAQLRTMPPTTKDYGAMSESEFVQDLESAGYTVESRGGGTYELTRTRPGPGGAVVSTRITMEKAVGRILRTEVYRDGHLAMSYTHEGNGTQETLHVTAHGRTSGDTPSVSYARPLPD